jgi:hypothetical protein
MGRVEQVTICVKRPTSIGQRIETQQSMLALSPPRGAEVTRAPVFIPDRRIFERVVPNFLGARLSHDRDNPAYRVIA